MNNMSDVFGGGMFGQRPSALEEMRKKIEQDKYMYEKMNNAAKEQSGATGLLQEFQGVINSLGKDEQADLYNITEFVHAKTIYEQGFIDFLGSKHAAEYINTPIGKQAMENLIDISKRATQQIRDANKEKTEKMQAMLDIMESDPEIQAKLQERLKTGKKSKK